MLYKLRKFIWKTLHLNKPMYCKNTIVYFPNVKKFFKVFVTSVRHKKFSGIFVDISDYSKSGVANYYGQIENDVVFDLETWTPIDFNEK